MNWSVTTLEEICKKVQSGGTPRTSNSEYYNGEIPWVKTKEVNFCKIYDTEIKITELGLKNSSAKLIPENSILIAMYGNGDTAGRCAINKIPLATNQACCNFTFDEEKANPYFMYYKISSHYRDFVHLKSGGAQLNLNGKRLKEFQVEIPPLTVQQNIASILSAYDDLMENNVKRIKLLEEAAQHLYKEWFINFRFPGSEKKPIDKKSNLPEGWEKKPLKETCNLTMGQSPKSEFYNEKKDGLPFHQGVTGYRDRFVKHSTYCTKETRIAEAGDILCSVRAPVGRLNISPDKIIIGRGLSAIKNKSNFQSFQYYQLKSHFFQEDMIGGGAIFNSVTKKVLESQELLVPNKTIIENFEKIVSPMDKQIKSLVLQNDSLKEARDLLLPRLMNRTIEV